MIVHYPKRLNTIDRDSFPLYSKENRFRKRTVPVTDISLKSERSKKYSHLSIKAYNNIRDKIRAEKVHGG